VPEAQLAVKERHLHETLQRIGGVRAVTRWAPIPGPVWGYRRRARLGARKVDRKGRVLVGFRERRAPLVADMDSCAVLAGGMGGLLPALSALIGALGIARRVPQVEVAVGDDRSALVFRVLETPSAEDLLLLERFGIDHKVDVWLQPGGLDTLHALRKDTPRLLTGCRTSVSKLHFCRAISFRSTAPSMPRRSRVQWRCLSPHRGRAWLTCSVAWATSASPWRAWARGCDGVEGDAGLVGRARENAARNGLDVSFHVADLFMDCRKLPWACEPCDALLLDPPRAGAEASIRLMPALRPARIVYLSCHPATLARDAGILVNEFGYRLHGAGVMDMFPHTAHVESIALFARGRG
jgi:23S rRNA (uracil1939-C5)-methyltransferase